MSHLNYIREMAKKSLATIGEVSTPIPIERVAEKLGLKVIEFDFPNSLSGVLKKERGVIGVNKNHTKARRRFTVAHELGHFVLGHDLGKDEDVVDDHFDKPIPKEREANMFASEILMPADIVRKEVKSNGIVLKNLSTMFDVSEQAMTIRLLDLGLI